MRSELNTYTLNIKSLNQDIEDCIIAGSGDTHGWTLRVIFTQEASKQFAENTKVYLNWHHLGEDLYGYNVFTQVCKNIWEISWPAAMIAHAGNVLARIELVDNISISPSSNFIIKVLSNPNNDSRFDDKDDYAIFSQAALELNSTNELYKKQLNEQMILFNEMCEHIKNLEERFLTTVIGNLPEDITIVKYIDTKIDELKALLPDE